MFGKLLDSALNVLDEASNTLGDAANDALDTASDYASTAIDTAGDYAADTLDTASDYTSTAVDIFSDYANDVFEVASETFDTATDYAHSTIELAADWVNDSPIVEIAEPALEEVRNVVQNAGETVTKFVESIAGTAAPIVEEVNNVFQDAGTAVTEFVEPIVEVAAPVLEAVTDTVQDAGEAVVEFAEPITEAAATVVETVTNTLEDPGTAGAETAAWVVEGANDLLQDVSGGIAETTSEAMADVNELWQSTTEPIENWWNTTTTSLSGWWNTGIDRDNPVVQAAVFVPDVFIGVVEGGWDTVAGIATLSTNLVDSLPGTAKYAVVPGSLFGDLLLDPGEVLERATWQDEDTKSLMNAAAQVPSIASNVAQDPSLIGQKTQSFLGAVWDSLTDPYEEDWNNKRPGQAIGRGIFEIGSLFIPAGGAAKASKAVGVVDDVARVGNLSDDVARVGNLSDDVARVGNLSDDAARVGGDLTEAEQLIAQLMPSTLKLTKSHTYRLIREAGLESESAIGKALFQDEMGLKVVDGNSLSGNRGFDNLLEDANGKLYINENKVKFSDDPQRSFANALGEGYGHKQGSRGWTEAVANEMLKSNDEATRIAGQKVLNNLDDVEIIGTYVRPESNSIEIYTRVGTDGKTWKLDKTIKWEEIPD